jgi:hypothetical protein
MLGKEDVWRCVLFCHSRRGVFLLFGLPIEHVFGILVFVGGADLLAEAIDKLDFEDGGGADELRDLFCLRSRLDAQISRRVAGFDASSAWADDGCRSAAAWLVKHCRQRDTSARKLVLVARQARHMPLVKDAWEAGSITTQHVEVLARTRKAVRADDRFAELEASFTTLAQVGSPEDVEAAAKQFRDVVDQERRGDPDTAHESRALYLSKILDGVRVLNGRTDALGGAIINRAVQRQVARAHKDDGRTPAQERIDALVAICNRDLHGQPSSGNTLPHVGLYTDLGTLRGEHVGDCETDDGIRVSPDIARRVACDCLVSRIVVDAKREVLDLGRSVRSFTLAQRRAVIVRYPTCVGVGCRIPSSETQMHHEWWWEADGPTDLDNALPLCAHDHWLLHEGHWRVERDGASGIVTWYRPDGTIHGHTQPRTRPNPIPIRKRE